MPDINSFDYDVFISYSSRDKAWVRNVLLQKIEEAGYKVLIDFRDFKAGLPSISEIERGVKKSRKTLIILTPDYLNSEWCELESIMAQTLSPSNRSFRIVPLLKMPCDKPLYIGALIHIDFTERADLDLAWHQLFNALALPCADSFRAEEKPIPSEIKDGLDQAKILMDGDRFSEAVPILERLRTVADLSNHVMAKVKVRLRLAQALYEAKEDFLLSEQLYRDTLAIAPTGDLDIKFNALHGLGDMLIFSGRLNEAKATVQKSIDVAKLTGKDEDMAEALISSSILERSLGFQDSSIARLDDAVQLLYKMSLSLSFDEKKRNAYMLAVCFVNKAFICRDYGNLDEALALYKKAEEQQRISADELDSGKTLIFRGEVHCAKAEWEKGFDCFRRSLEHFKKAANPLWGARSLEKISLLYATHERWEESLRAILGAVAGAEESGHHGEQVHFLCLAARILRNLKEKTGKDNVARIVHNLSKNIPEEIQAEIMSNLTAKMGEMFNSLEKAVQVDEEVRSLLKDAKKIAQNECLDEHLANCILEEIQLIVLPNDIETRRSFINQSIELLKKELDRSQSPKRRGHLMGRICALYLDLGDSHEALSWLKRAGEIFKKSGDIFGLANYNGSLAEIYRVEGRSDDEITAYRKALSEIEGRSFHNLSAGMRINLAAALRHRKEYDEAQRLLDEAESLCNRYHLKNMIPAIARNRNDIERELQVARAPTQTLSQLLSSLRQLIQYHPEYAEAYLPFWYFAWQTELLALLRSGPYITFMVVTDEVDRFMRFATKFKHLADHFLMATSQAPTIEVSTGVLPIPPKWLFPINFPFLAIKREGLDSKKGEHHIQKETNNDSPPSFNWQGPARMLPLYIMIEAKSSVKGEGHVSALTTPYLPQPAIDLMVRRPTKELIDKRVIWFPTDRFAAKDLFLSDLHIGHERGVFPVYFDRLPTSEAAIFCGRTIITVSNKLSHHEFASKWRRSLLKLTKLPKDAAQAALIDLPELFVNPDESKRDSSAIEVFLFEFGYSDQRLFHPVLLVRGPLSH